MEDWILENIRKTMKVKGIKIENISKALGISVGEFSKVLNGQRRNYYRYLPEIANYLGTSFHDLVKNNDNILSQFPIKSEGLEYEKLSGLESKKYFGLLIQHLESTIIMKDEIINLMKELNQVYKSKDNEVTFGGK